MQDTWAVLVIYEVYSSQQPIVCTIGTWRYRTQVLHYFGTAPELYVRGPHKKLQQPIMCTIDTRRYCGAAPELYVRGSHKRKLKKEISMHLKIDWPCMLSHPVLHLFIGVLVVDPLLETPSSVCQHGLLLWCVCFFYSQYSMIMLHSWITPLIYFSESLRFRNTISWWIFFLFFEKKPPLDEQFILKIFFFVVFPEG